MKKKMFFFSIPVEFSLIPKLKMRQEYAYSMCLVFFIYSVAIHMKNVSCYRVNLSDYLPWILTTPATYLLKAVASITGKSI